MNKTLIQSRFSKSLSSYNDNAIVQKKMAEKLITKLGKYSYNNILEIGCGTGFLTELAVKNLDYKKYTAVDIVAECEQYISNIDSSIEFIATDIEKFLQNNHEKYDLILSNASLQWVENFTDFSKILLSHLSEDGELNISLFGNKNFKEITLLLNKSLSYLSKDEYYHIFDKSLDSIEEELLELHFEHSIDVLKHMRSTGVNSLERVFWTKSNMFKFDKEYKELCPSVLTLTYNPIYIKICNKK